MATCQICQVSSPLIAANLGVCAECARRFPEKAWRIAEQTHRLSRREFDLPEAPPHAVEKAVACPLCANACQMAEGERGYCGLRVVQGDRLVHLAGTPDCGLLDWYYDPLPTNCVADWVCSGHTQYGHNNLAVFYEACTFNCLFCQNWHYRRYRPAGRGISAAELAAAADARTFCVCYFGGDPTPQMHHALATSEILAARGVRICWETNGSLAPSLLRQAVELSLATGGCLKFDLKAYDEGLHRVLTGASNQRTLENFALAAGELNRRPAPPLLIASTLLVPGYVDVQEVGQIARFIASLNPDIPYALLAFYPHFYLDDLPRTSVGHATEAEAAARAAGLTNVRIGNRHLLSRAY